MLKEMYAQFIASGSVTCESRYMLEGTYYIFTLVGTDMVMEVFTDSPSLCSDNVLSIMIEIELIKIEWIKFSRRK
jgi:hypothetical protein